MKNNQTAFWKGNEVYENWNTTNQGLADESGGDGSGLRHFRRASDARRENIAGFAGH
jgi:hypothetical protein